MTPQFKINKSTEYIIHSIVDRHNVSESVDEIITDILENCLNTPPPDYALPALRRCVEKRHKENMREYRFVMGGGHGYTGKK
jgi:hypothetical protein